MIKLDNFEFEDYKGQKAQGIILLDLAWILHRGYHAIPTSTFIDDKEVKTGHYFSLVKTIIQARKNFPFYSIVLCLDSYPEEKHKLHKEYKVGRPKHFNLKDVMVDSVMMTCALKGVYCAISKGKESDEVMYSISRQYDEGQVIIMSGDNDLIQAINGSVKLVRSLTLPLKEINQEYVTNKFGVLINEVLAFRVLVGDSSDKISGVMGKASAIKLVKENSIEEIIEKLEGSKSDAERNYKLMKLNEIPVYYYKSIHSDAMNLAKKFKLNSLINLLRYE